MGPVSSGSLGSPNQGYIIITTKQNFQESGTDLMLSYGSYNQIKGGVYVAKKINDNFRFSVGYNK